jgi:hypothetical protein
VRLIRSFTSHSLQALAEAGIISLLVVALIALPAFSARGGGGGGKGKPNRGGSGTITMQMVDPADTTPNWGDWVTFTVSTTSTDQPWVNLKCYQDGTLVAEGWNGYFEGSLTGRNFGLYSPQWTSGAAECTANLTNPQWQVLGTTSFHVYE